MTSESSTSTTPLPPTPMPIEAIATYPLPGMNVPGTIAFSPDDQLITYLHSADASLVRQLYAYRPATGQRQLLLAPADTGTTEEQLSIEEALRRERQRQRELGVTTYAWAKHTNRILVPLNDGLYAQDGVDAPLRKIVSSQGHPVLDPQWSPDGTQIAYVQDAELYVVSAAGGDPRQLTDGARGTGKTHGLAEYIAQEEMDRSHGFWWSQDSAWLAFTEVDETHIPIYRIVHQGKDNVGEGAQEEHHYPFAGMANAKVRLGIVAASGGEPTWLDWGNDDTYLARVDWLPDGSLGVQIENREQSMLELVRFDVWTGERVTLLRETSDVWINLHHMFKPLQQGSFVWASERSGFRHLYLYDAEGTFVQQLTAGEWMVDEIAGVDEQHGQVYFLATKDGPTERQLYRVSLAGGEPQRITMEPGSHAVVLDHAFERFVDVHHSTAKPPTITLRSLHDGIPLSLIYDEIDPRIAELELQPPELVELQSRDGIPLYGALYRPPAAFGAGPHPTIVLVYGGPHVQLVADSWLLTVAMRAQYLRSLGFAIFILDNRGSARRGLAFEGAIKHNMGQIEVEDQVDGVGWLVGQGITDRKRVGINGWSYGGYMAAMCLARTPETFRVAVAGAPVTHWDGYDTHYTERYMGTPASNPEGYARSSVINYVNQISGKLLLVHGLIDENVHFRHTARLINALIHARKPYDLLLFPNERHMPRGIADRIFMEEQIRDYFLRHLGVA